MIDHHKIMENDLALLELEYLSKKCQILDKYSIMAAKYKIGDIVGNVTGYIKVSKIEAVDEGDRFGINIQYSGKSIRKSHGEWNFTKKANWKTFNESRIKKYD